jgi:hypothetical protein
MCVDFSGSDLAAIRSVSIGVMKWWSKSTQKEATARPDPFCVDWRQDVVVQIDTERLENPPTCDPRGS